MIQQGPTAKRKGRKWLTELHVFAPGVPKHLLNIVSVWVEIEDTPRRAAVARLNFVWHERRRSLDDACDFLPLDLVAIRLGAGDDRQR